MEILCVALGIFIVILMAAANYITNNNNRYGF